MVMIAKPANTRPPRSEQGLNELNPLYPSILATVVLCSILTTIFAAARLIAKRLISAYNIEDYMLMVAWAANIAFDFGLLGAGLAGLGNHIWYIQETQYVKLAQYAWALEILYTQAIWLAKASLLFQLIRIFTPMKSGALYWAFHILIWGNLVFYSSIFFSLIFECHPIREVWNPSYEGHCINRNMLLVVSSAVNIFSDLLNLLLPIWATWHLQMAPKRKAGIIAIFATGILSFVSSICRLVYTTHIISRPDVSYIVAQTALWGLAEITTIILCTCFPMMPRFVRLLSDRFSHTGPSPPSPKMKVRKSKIFRVGNAQSSTGISSVGPQEDDMAWLKSPYQQLGEEGSDSNGQKDVVRDLGTKRTVDIEMATWDQINAKSRVASMAEGYADSNRDVGFGLAWVKNQQSVGRRATGVSDT
ncbi:hypothetical protein IMSHALPRED_007390 [Imshaugia aleurites]|uniref:Rhodopsin domain-containing protein n=1 Tax=Imshaugia aleurites TaxID=172621 RepID=A0A8H3IQU9_9LECA|nr:hypothetical protein IMSHALPRED_007390 [Imshaugia aleurites]